MIRDDLKTTVDRILFRAKWRPEEEQWVCDCRLFSLWIWETEDGIDYASQTSRLDTRIDALEVQRRLVRKARQAVKESE